VTAPPGKVRFSHHLSPADVLELARQLYGAAPQAFCVSLTGQCFEHGVEFSKSVAGRLPQLASKVEQLTNQVLSGSTASLDSSQEAEAAS
jgi:Ni,Fe-hydrogenase maturation factor